MFFVIALRSDPNMFWCGYEPNPANPGGGCHVWLAGKEGADKAVRFYDQRSAHRAGVGAPNTPYGRADTAPHRGVHVVMMAPKQEDTQL